MAGLSKDETGPPGPELKWVHGEAALAALRAEWLSLETRAPRPYFYQSFSWFWARIQCERPAFRRTVRCITAWDRGSLVAVWPFVIENRFGCRIARRLGCGSDVDYCPPLIDRGADAAQLSALLYGEVRRVADILLITVIKADDPLFNLLEPLPPSEAGRWSSDVIILEMKKAASWEEFEKGLSAKLVKSIRYEKKRLAGSFGEFSVRQAETDEELRSGLEFFLTKVQRNKKKGKFDWFHRPEARCFLEKVLTTGSGPGLKLLTAWAGEHRLATALFAVERDRGAFFETTYNEAFASHSPGKLLLEGCLKWAIERGLTIDFGPMAFPYKERWGGDELVACRSYTIVATPYGRAFEPVRFGLEFGMTRMRRAKAKVARYVGERLLGRRKALAES